MSQMIKENKDTECVEYLAQQVTEENRNQIETVAEAYKKYGFDEVSQKLQEALWV